MFWTSNDVKLSWIPSVVPLKPSSPRPGTDAFICEIPPRSPIVTIPPSMLRGVLIWVVVTSLTTAPAMRLTPLTVASES